MEGAVRLQAGSRKKLPTPHSQGVLAWTRAAVVGNVLNFGDIRTH